MTAVVTHHAAMGYHGVGTGFMPSERQRLTEWAAQALAPHFTPVADLSTDRRVKATPKALLKPHVSVPNEDGTPEVAARIAARNTKNAEIDVTNARLRRRAPGAGRPAGTTFSAATCSTRPSRFATR